MSIVLAMLSNSILKVSIESTESEGKMRIGNELSELVVDENTTVGIVVLNIYCT